MREEAAAPRPFSELLRDVPLTPGRIHVLQASLDGGPEELTRFFETLTEEERERAARLRFEVDRSRFIAARGLLREALGGYLDLAPREVPFVYAAKGKPSVADSKLEFNASDSGDIAVFAFAWEMPLGIDVEQIRPLDNLEGVGRRFFSPVEWSAIEAMPPEQRQEAFFRCWTRKEAFVKATGDGLSYGLKQFDVSVSGPARILRIRDDTGEAAHWSMHDLSLPQGYMGALACRGTGFKIYASFR